MIDREKEFDVPSTNSDELAREGSMASSPGRYVAPPEQRRYSVEEIHKAQDLKRQGLSWSAIGRRLGRHTGSIASAVWRYERGQYNRTFETLERTQSIITAAQCGASIPQIVKKYGGNRISIDMLLRYHGFDAEVRREYRRKPIRMAA